MNSARSLLGKYAKLIQPSETMDSELCAEIERLRLEVAMLRFERRAVQLWLAAHAGTTIEQIIACLVSVETGQKEAK